MNKIVSRSLFIVSFILIMTGLVIYNLRSNNNIEKDTQIVSKGMLDYDNYYPVVSNVETISRPYFDEGVNLVLGFYEVSSSEEEQELAIINSEGTYIQSNGVAYSKGEPFQVISILDGTVKEVTMDDVVGNIIVIEHNNGYKSTYESVSDISVEVGMPVVQGQVIAKSSTSNILKNLDNHLYFELSKDNNIVNPESYYNRSVNE